MDLCAVNSLSEEHFVRTFLNVVERHEACATHLCKLRPYQSAGALLQAASEYLDNLPATDVEHVLLLHPDLAGRVVAEEELTEESQGEQRAAGLRTISHQLTQELAQLNALYKAKFGFPFIICARDNKFDAILKGLRARLANQRQVELSTALQEVKKITAYRIQALIK